MPTITNFGDVLTVGNAVVQGTGSSTFAGPVSAPSFSGNISGLNFGSFLNLYSQNSLVTTNVLASAVNLTGTLSTTNNVWAANALSAPTVLVSTATLTGASGQTTLSVTGNSYISNALTTTNLLAATTTLSGTTGQTTLNLTGNLTASNSLSTTNLIATGNLNVQGISNLWVANIANIYTTNIIGFIGSQWTGTIGSTIYYINQVGIGTSTASSNLQVAGNVYASNAMTTQNLFANTLTLANASASVTGNIYVSNALTTTNVLAATATLSGTTGQTTLNVTGNLYVSNALTTTNIWANTLTLANAAASFTGNLYVSNALSTTNLIATGNLNVQGISNLWVANIANIYTTNIVGFIGSQWTTGTGNVYYLSSVGIGTGIVPSTLQVAGNAYVSNALDTTNVNVTGNVNTAGFLISGTAGTSGQILTATGVGGGIQWTTGGTATQWTGSIGSPIYYINQVGIGTSVTSSNLQVTGNAVVSNALTTTNVLASTTTLSGTAGQATLNATGNAVVSNTLTTTNVLASTTTLSGTAGQATLNATGNAVVSNTLTTTNVLASTTTLSGTAGQATLNATGNAVVSNTLTTTNVLASTTTLSGTAGQATLNATGNLFASNAITTTNITSTGNINATGFLISGLAGTNGQVITATGVGGGIQWAAAGSQWTSGTNNVYYLANVGIGTSYASYQLTVTGTAQTKAAPYSNLTLQTGGWYQAYQASTATSLKIFTDGNIGCTELDVFSDKRIKTDIQDVSPEECLDLVSKLRVCEFKYKDSLEHGPKTYKGLLAQEVRDVVDEAVSLHEGVIPDIFQVPKSFSSKRAQFENKIEGVSVGDTIKVLDENVEKRLRVIAVSDFEIEFSDVLTGPKVFVYGRLVNDLHTVSYERLFPILLSAFQYLAKKVETTLPTPSATRTSL